jgi:hypothetical protein
VGTAGAEVTVADTLIERAGKALVVLPLMGAMAGCGPQLAWYGHSPDRGQPVSVLQQDGAEWLSVGGRVSRRYRAIAADDLAFDEEGRRMAFAAELGDQPERWTVVVDRVEGPTWRGVAGLRFGPRGKRFVYAALDGTSPASPGRGRNLDAQWRMVIDGSPQRPFDTVDVDSITFSPDGRRVGYVADEHDCEHAVVDGIAGSCVGRVVGLALADDESRDIKVVAEEANGSSARVFVGPESVADLTRVAALSVDPARRHWAVVAGSEPGWRVVVDGRAAGEPFDRIGRVQWAPDGSAVAYVARRDRAAYVVVGGRTEGPHAEIEDPVFAASGARVGFIARDADRSAVTIDDRIVWESSAAATGLALSHDGLHSGWFYRDARDAVIAMDGRAYRFEVAVERTLRFSRDDRHWAALVGSLSERKLFVVVDGKVRLPFDSEEFFGMPAAVTDPAERLGAWVSAELELYLARTGTRGS